MKRNVVLIGILVIGGAVSAWMWMSKEEETDQNLAQMKQTFACSKCSNEFELTIAESTAMYQSDSGVVCPKCNEGGAAKRDVKFMMGGFGSSDEPESTPQEDESGENAKAFGAIQRANPR